MNYPDLARIAGRLDPEAVTVQSIMGVIGRVVGTDEIWRDHDDIMDALDTYETITGMADDPDVADEILAAIALHPHMFPRAHQMLKAAAEKVRDESAGWLAEHIDADRTDDAIARIEDRSAEINQAFKGRGVTI